MLQEDARALRRLDRSAGKVIRHRTERLLRKADKAVHHLRDHDDARALHDSRVALRRLRSWLRAFRQELPVTHERRRALKRLSHSTNDARDAEVGLQWLSRVKRGHIGQMRDGISAFSSELEAARHEDYSLIRRRLPAAWRRQARELRRKLAESHGSSAPFRQVFLASLRAHARDFGLALARARRIPTPPYIHALRISGKRLLYLVDTALPSGQLAGKFTLKMRELHDSAGAIQDLQCIQALAGRRRQTGRRRTQAKDLKLREVIARATAQEQTELILRFRKLYLGERPCACVRELQALMRHLGDRPKAR